MHKFFKCLFILPLVSTLLLGCASSRSGNVYSRDQARQAHSVKYGTIESVRNVEIEGTRSGVGAVAGGAAGGAVGSTIGKGGGRTVATVIGAIAGGIAGHSAEESLTKKEGLEITVKLDDGESIAVVQEADEDFQTGDRVKILAGPDGTTRIVH